MDLWCDAINRISRLRRRQNETECCTGCCRDHVSAPPCNMNSYCVIETDDRDGGEQNSIAVITVQ
eukprot:CCRYP_016058-RA/>CCRYP_016058-RA protein AED:0.00 eAED:0.00 QI:79/1/1/1/0/0/2/0/64